LTVNFAVKGGYSGGEDYRWAEVRRWFPGWRYELFNLVFIATFQQLELLAISAPAVAAMDEEAAPLGWLDVVAASLWVGLLTMQTVADWQMFRFQTEKYRRKAAGIPLGPRYEAGFIDSGLWAYSRHPNYFCEVGLWWVYYGFSIAATGRVINWTVLGPLFLTLLFVPPGASIDVTEALSSRKYPLYPEYQARVSRFVPWFPRRPKTA
jgi:steroid 5-alpha reductase family enzyme